MQKRIWDLQKQLYKDAKQEAMAVATLSDEYMQSLQVRMDQLVTGQPFLVEGSRLIESIVNHPCTLFGDFHTLRQSQRGLLRLLRDTKESYPDRTLAVGMECFRSKDQPLIEAFITGKMTAEELREQSNFERGWGFSWPNYLMILEYCKENGLSVLAINHPDGGKKSLDSRDKFAAERVHEFLKTHKDTSLIIQIGEYHLLDDRFPTFLKQAGVNEDIVRIFSNLDGLFFTQKDRAAQEHSLFFEIGPQDFSIQNVSPWLKWQSVTQHEEQADCEEWVKSDEHTQYKPDHDYVFIDLLRRLCNFLQYPFDERLLDYVAVVPLIDHNGDEITEFSDRPSSQQCQWVRLAESNGAFLAADDSAAIVRHVSLNNLANAAGQFLFWHHYRGRLLNDNGWDIFCQLVAGQVAAKIINPRKKLDRLSNIQHSRESTLGVSEPIHTELWGANVNELPTLLNRWFPGRLSHIARAAQLVAGEIYTQAMHQSLKIDTFRLLLGAVDRGIDQAALNSAFAKVYRNFKSAA